MFFPHSDPMVNADYTLYAEKFNGRDMIKSKESMEKMLNKEGFPDIGKVEQNNPPPPQFFSSTSK